MKALAEVLCLLVQEDVSFVRDIEPLFRASCISCHGPEKQKGKLRLDSRELSIRGGDSGQAIVPGNSRESRLVRLLLSSDPEERMPQKSKPWSRDQIARVATWIDQGAVWPDSASVKVKEHWAYVKQVRRPGSIDEFIRARLKREGLSLSPEAPREALLRRLSLDLIGLPPGIAELEEFLNDPSPDAYERQVDRLLSSPHYGERWARPWLDLARYADTNGYEADRRRSHWPWRDWVIRAFNQDMPFDRFTIEQIAGDMLPGATVDQRIATGFHRNAMLNEEGGVDKEEARWDTLVERVNTTAAVWLGTTLACAQCHNHKYDPFTQKDFYRLVAFFDNTEYEIKGKTPTSQNLFEPTVEITDARGKAVAGVMRERVSHEWPSTYLRIRGGYLAKGEKVYAGVPESLPPLPPHQLPNRLGLARWLVDPENPLTARVTVNRFWEQLFGRGIVETSEDFGTQGARPTHPELLDWLATEFMRRGWSMKALLRTIVMSATYRQSSRATPALLEKDPYNRLFARGPRFRMEAEMIRDTALAASGLLSRRIGGPSVFPPQPEGIWFIPEKNDTWVTQEGEDRWRRGLYTFWRRSAPYPSFVAFDAPSRELCTVRRSRTNTPLQALTLLNDPACFEAARAMARRIISEGGDDPASRATYGFRLCVARAPERKEVDALLALHERQRARGGEESAWSLISNVLLNLDETVTKE